MKLIQYNFVHDVGAVFTSAKYCLITFNSIDIFQNLYFALALKSGCIPIIAGHDHILPYENLIDWSRAVIRIGIQELGFLNRFLSEDEELQKLQRKQGQFFFDRYFKVGYHTDRTTIIVILS